MNAEFEKYAREQLSHYEMSIDTDALWAGVSAQIRPEKPRRKGGLWFFLLGIVVGLGLVALFFANDNIQTEASSAVIHEANANKLHQQSSGTPAAIDNAQEKSLNTTTSDSNDPLVKEEPIVNINSTKEASATSKNISVASNSKSLKLQRGANNSNIPPTSTNTLPVTDSDDNISTISDKGKQPALGISVVREQFQALKPLPTLSPGFLHSEKDFSPEFLAGFKTLPANFGNKDFKKRGRRKGAFFRDLRFGLGLYGGLSRSNADLEAKNASAEEFLLLRTNTEKQLETIHLGLNAIVQSEQNFFFRTGIEYTRIASLFSRNSQVVEQDSVPGIVEIQINGITGERDTIFGDVLVTRTTDYRKKSYNYFHLVDVPVIIGYNFGTDPWRIGVEAGIYANVFIRNKGDIGLESGEFYDIGEDEEEWYRNNIGISPYVGINAAYNVSENIQIHLTPSFRFNSLFSTDANPLEQQHGNLGVRAGVRYIFD